MAIKGPYSARKKHPVQEMLCNDKNKEIHPEFILRASSEVLHSTGLLLSSVLWVKHAILEKQTKINTFPVSALCISVQLESISKRLCNQGFILFAFFRLLGHSNILLGQCN